MASDIKTSRNRLIAGIAILAILLLVAVIFLVISFPRRIDEPRTGSRSPLTELDYCSPDDVGLCVVSFSQIVDGDMQVNIHTPRVFYPRFVLVINRYGVESAYECGKENPLSHNAECFGPPQVPGEILQFKIFFKEQGTLVAEGKFAIIGVALSTPEVLPTPTPEVTETPAMLPTRTPAPTRVVPATSYPNPSYPNPSSP